MTVGQAPLGAEILFESAACGLLVTSEDGLILRANATFCAWLGYQQHELAGRRFQDLLTMGGRIFHQTHWLPLMRMQGSVREVKLELLGQHRQTVAVLINGVRCEQGGAFFHQLAVFGTADRDRYEREILASRKLAEAALREKTAAEAALLDAQRKLSLDYEAAKDRASFAEQMVAIVSHDLKTPLTAIGLASEVLGRGNRDAKESRILGHIRHSAQRAERMIRDLLDFTLVRVGRGIRIVPEPTDLHTVIGRCVEEIQVAFPAAVLRHHAHGSGLAPLDSDRAQQVAANLIANSIAYGEPGQAITVTSRIEGTRASLSVHNTGRPIPENIRDRLFEPMVRGITGGDRRSVGLGLFIVREVVEAHGGRVTVDSSEAEGTTFTACFYAAPASLEQVG
ncbi:PAS domain-containing sensor histidine kinase [Pseudomonas sp. RIT-PI-S]|uniref:sensor histidine kinase n=1 Tax=Pseudomonas sp. RIT-PI-S TaxID=3035295 RepID=UPI0021DABF89|nr:PAS domain-containing sensor histidine kinase [Pseudomonas sp. RIT-PI-S]